MEEVAIGKFFAGKNELFSFFEEYFQKTYQPFVRHVITNTRIVFRCAHWRRRKSQATGKRPNQHYLFTGCNAHINLYKGKENYWKVTLVELGHNHAIGKEEYSMYRRRAKLTYQDYKLMSKLIQAKVKDSVVADVLKTKRAKFLKRRDVTNIRAKLFRDRYLQNQIDDADVNLGLDSESAVDSIPRVISAELNDKLMKFDKVKTLTESEKYKIACEFFNRRAEMLSKLDTREFYERMQELQNCKELSLEDVPAFAEVPESSF